MIASIAEETPDLKYRIAPMPAGPAGLVAKQLPTDGWNYLVNSQSEHVDAIMDMLIALCDKESDIYIHEKRGTAPVLADSFGSDYVRSLPYGEIMTVYATSKESPEYNLLGGAQATTIAGEELVKMIMGDQSAEEAVNNAAVRMDEMLKTLE